MTKSEKAVNKSKQHGPFTVLGKSEETFSTNRLWIYTHKGRIVFKLKTNGATLRSKEILGAKTLNAEQVCYSHEFKPIKSTPAFIMKWYDVQKINRSKINTEILGSINL